MADYDLIVIGGGSGGLTATSAARKLGARVLLLEKKALGGDCLFTGCVPSKTLIRTAAVAHLANTAARYGLVATLERPDGKKVMDHVREVIAQIAEHDSPATFEKMGAEVRIGAPRFVSPEAIELDGKRISARAFIVATGSRPALPDIPGLKESVPLTNETVFELSSLPESLLVMGAGAIGLELGQALARLGVSVTIVESAERVLPREDSDCSTEIRARLEAEGIAIHTATRVERVRKDGARSIIECTQAGTPVSFTAAALLVATGRAPNTDDLGLAAAGVDFDARRIIIDQELRTTNPRVFAVGDVTAKLPFTHAAGYQAVLAVRNALLPLSSRADYHAIPWTTFTAPEVARVGPTEEEARASDPTISVWRASFREVDRALTDGEPHGFVKLIATSNRLIAAHIVSAHAGELIHAPELALTRKLPLSSLATMSWVYPTMSEGIRKASQSRFESMLEKGTTRKVLSLLSKLKGG